MCKHTLTHIIAKKCNFCLKKKAKNHDSGDFWNLWNLQNCENVQDGIYIILDGIEGCMRIYCTRHDDIQRAGTAR